MFGVSFKTPFISIGVIDCILKQHKSAKRLRALPHGRRIDNSLLYDLVCWIRKMDRWIDEITKKNSYLKGVSKKTGHFYFSIPILLGNVDQRKFLRFGFCQTCHEEQFLQSKFYIFPQTVISHKKLIWKVSGFFETPFTLPHSFY